jgi:transcriptional repressor NrdR
MKCPKCQFPDSKVLETRASGDTLRRRRECLNEACGERFTTHERIEARLPWIVKKDGRREPFAREKVLHGIALAVRKRPVDAAGMEDAVRRVETALENLREEAVRSSVVGELVMQVLLDVDAVAYVRFASVYRAFESVDQFVETIHPLRDRS